MKYSRPQKSVNLICLVILLLISIQANAQVLEKIGQWRTFTNTLGFDVAGQYAYVGMMNDSLKILDISNPQNPIAVGGCALSGIPWDVAVLGDYAYIAEGPMEIVNISDPTNPEVVNYLNQTRGFTQIKIQGNFLYFVAGLYQNNRQRVLGVYDLTNPINPTFISNDTTYSLLMNVDVNGQYAYVGHFNGVSVWDISVPANPTIMGLCYIPQNALDIVADGEFAYVANDDSGLQIINVADPHNPFRTSNLRFSERAEKIAKSGNLVYLTGRQGRLYIINVEDPAHPFLTGNFNTDYQIMDIKIGGDSLFYITPYIWFNACRYNNACNLMLGDINNDKQITGADVIYAVRYFKGLGLAPAESCFVYSMNSYFYTSGDVNADCYFRGSDITRLVAYFKSTAILESCSSWPLQN
jgi:hypothetical protein